LEVSNELTGREHLGKQAVEGSEKRSLDTLGGNVHPVEREFSSRTGIVRQVALESKIGGSTSGRVNTHMRHHSSNN